MIRVYVAEGLVLALTSIGHTQQPPLGVLDFEVLISKLLAIDTHPARAIPPGEVPSLDHKVLDDPMEATALVGQSLPP